MGKKNKKNKRQRTEEHHDGVLEDVVANEDGFIPNGFTIDFDDFDDNTATARRKNTRKNGSSNVDDEDEDSTQQAPRGGYGSQVLPFASNLPEDHTGEPLDGHEYLFLVRREAAAHPSVKTAEAFVRRVEEEVVMEASTSAALPSHRPSVEWRTSFLSRFSNMRQVMASSSSQPASADVPSHYLPIPAAQDESSWRTYINGRKGKGRAVKDTDNSVVPSASADSGIDMDMSTDDLPVDMANGDVEEQDLKGTTTAPTGIESSSAGPSKPVLPTKVVWTEPRPPIPTLMRALEHYTIISLLEHYQGWLSDRLEDISNAHAPSTVFLPPSMMRKKKKALPVTTAESSTKPPAPTAAEPILPITPLVLTSLDSQWIFSLLTVLDPLLSSGEISTLRGLARTCQDIADFTWNEQQRWLNKGAASGELDKYAESIGGCWMINAAIWEIWGQRDLWE